MGRRQATCMAKTKPITGKQYDYGGVSLCPKNQTKGRPNTLDKFVVHKKNICLHNDSRRRCRWCSRIL